MKLVKIERISKANYLSYGEARDHTKDVFNKLHNTWTYNMYSIINRSLRNRMKKETQVLYKVPASSVLLFGFENWAFL
jgi:hypothetical protein